MEKGPEFRIVGDASEEKKDEAKEAIELLLFDHQKSLETMFPRAAEQFKKFENKKSEKELALIDFANKETNKLMQEFGLKPYDIPADNYHIIPSELYKKEINRGKAITFVDSQSVVVDEEYFKGNLLRLGAMFLHETLHLKAHTSMEVEEIDGKIKTTPYRQGLRSISSQKYDDSDKSHIHFKGLEEAIVSAQEKKLFPKLLEFPSLAKENKWLMSDEAKRLKNTVAKNREFPEDEIIWVGKKEEDFYVSFSFLAQRRVLDYICEEIQKEFPDLYENADDVFKEFLQANFTGRLLPIARLVDGTFGEGSFRVLGNMSNEKESAVLTLETLKKARARQTE